MQMHAPGMDVEASSQEPWNPEKSGCFAPQSLVFHGLPEDSTSVTSLGPGAWAGCS